MIQDNDPSITDDILNDGACSRMRDVCVQWIGEVNDTLPSPIYSSSRHGRRVDPPSVRDISVYRQMRTLPSCHRCRRRREACSCHRLRRRRRLRRRARSSPRRTMRSRRTLSPSSSSLLILRSASISLAPANAADAYRPASRIASTTPSVTARISFASSPRQR